MPTKPTVGQTDGAFGSLLGASIGSDQQSQRYGDTIFDQHRSTRFPDGRPFCGSREYAANKGHRDGFVGTDLMHGEWQKPHTTWSAPWLPEFRYLDINYKTMRGQWRYDKVAADDTLGLRTYYDGCAVMAAQMGGAEVKPYGIPSYQLCAIFGMPPRTPKIAQAAMAGDPWLLGADEHPNEELAALLGMSRRFGMYVQDEPIVPLATAADVLKAQASGTADLAAIVGAVLAALDARELAQKEANRVRTQKARSAPRKPKPQTAVAG